jgi:Tfp pilus assembly protein FimT
LSLIEAMVLVTGTAVIATAAVPSLVAFIDGRRLDAAATALAADIQFMRTEAVADGAGPGAIGANIEHPLDHVDVAGSLLAQNFLLVRGDQPGRPRAKRPCFAPASARCHTNPDPARRTP